MPPLVLLPGMNCTPDLWTGCGFEEATTPPLREDSMAGQINALLAELPPRFVLCGLSLGAIVAMGMAVRAPERVAGLVVVSTNAKAPTSVQRTGWAEWRTQLDNGTSPRALQESILPLLLSERARSGETGADLSERVRQMGGNTAPDVLRAQLGLQATRVDVRERLRALTVPTLVISGSEDAMCPPRFHHEIAEAIPDSRLVEVEGGHLLPMERPEAFGALVNTWRARVPAIA